jgi:type III secretory pathway component EscU
MVVNEIIAVTTMVGSLVTGGFSIAMFIVIKFNDLKHLELTVNDIKKSVDELVPKVANIEGRCSIKSKRRSCKVDK